MKLLNSDIQKFQQLYRDKFGIELNSIDARQKLLLLVRQVEIIHQPVTQEQIKKLKYVYGNHHEQVGSKSI